MANYNEDELDHEMQITQRDMNRPKHRQRHKYTKYKKCLDKIVLICIKQPLKPFETPFVKKLSNTEAELKKGVAYKK